MTLNIITFRMGVCIGNSRSLPHRNNNKMNYFLSPDQLTSEDSFPLPVLRLPYSQYKSKEMKVEVSLEKVSFKFNFHKETVMREQTATFKNIHNLQENTQHNSHLSKNKENLTLIRVSYSQIQNSHAKTIMLNLQSHVIGKNTYAQEHRQCPQNGVLLYLEQNCMKCIGLSNSEQIKDQYAGLMSKYKNGVIKGCNSQWNGIYFISNSLLPPQSNLNTLLSMVSLETIADPITALLLYVPPQAQFKFNKQYLLYDYFSLKICMSHYPNHLFSVSIQQMIEQTNGLYKTYFVIQILKLIIDFKIRQCKSQDSQQRNRVIVENITKMLILQESILGEMVILCRVVLSFRNQQSTVGRIVKVLIDSILLECPNLVQGLFIEFGFQINEFIHPYKKNPKCFVTLKQALKPNIPIIYYLTKQYAIPNIKLMYYILKQLQRLSSLTRPEQIVKSGQKSIQLIKKQFYQNQLQCRFLITEIQTLYINQFEVRVKIYSIVQCVLNNQNISQYQDGWTQIMNKVNSFHLVSGQLMLTIYGISGIFFCSQNSKLREYYFFKSIVLAHLIYGDPQAKTTWKRNYFQKWEAFVLELYTTDLRNTDRKQDYQFFYNLLQCLRYDLYTSAQGIQVKITDIMPIRSCSGIFYVKNDMDLEQTEESKLSISDCQSSISKKLKHSWRKLMKRDESVKLKDMQTVIQWGSGIKFPPLIKPELKNHEILAIQSGNFHTIFLTEKGLYGWGQGHSGQLGNNVSKNDGSNILTLLQIEIKTTDAFRIACGNQHTMMLLNNKLYVWGQQSSGICSGNGFNFDQIACGGLHSMGIKNGLVYSWGRGEGGQLGHPIDCLKSRKKQQTVQYYLDEPTQIRGLKNAVKVACGDAHSLVLTSQGEVYVFGFSYQGQLGLGITGDSQYFQVFEPIRLLSLKEQVIDIFAGPTSSFFKTKSNDIYSCGLNDCLQLGLERVMKVCAKKTYINRASILIKQRMGETEFSLPRKIGMFCQSHSEINVENIKCGENHCIALAKYQNSQQLVVGWGFNKHLQVGAQYGEMVSPRTLDTLFGLHIRSLCCRTRFSLALLGKLKTTTNLSLEKIHSLTDKA